jgi:hypothetical protein
MSRLLLALTVLALLPCSASADYGYPGERPAPAVVQSLARKADKFWHARRVASCASVRGVFMAPSLLDDDDGDGDVEMTGTGDGPTEGAGADGKSQDVDAAGRGGDCRVWIVNWLIKVTLHPNRFGTASDLCTVIFHEAGHTAGLGHSEFGLMAEWASTEPFVCRAWARRFENRKERARRKR